MASMHVSVNPLALFLKPQFPADRLTAAASSWSSHMHSNFRQDPFQVPLKSTNTPQTSIRTETKI